MPGLYVYSSIKNRSQKTIGNIYSNIKNHFADPLDKAGRSGLVVIFNNNQRQISNSQDLTIQVARRRLDNSLMIKEPTYKLFQRSLYIATQMQIENLGMKTILMNGARSESYVIFELDLGKLVPSYLKKHDYDDRLIETFLNNQNIRQNFCFLYGIMALNIYSKVAYTHEYIGKLRSPKPANELDEPSKWERALPEEMVRMLNFPRY